MQQREAKKCRKKIIIVKATHSFHTASRLRTVLCHMSLLIVISYYTLLFIIYICYKYLIIK